MIYLKQWACLLSSNLTRYTTTFRCVYHIPHTWTVANISHYRQTRGQSYIVFLVEYFGTGRQTQSKVRGLNWCIDDTPLILIIVRLVRQPASKLRQSVQKCWGILMTVIHAVCNNFLKHYKQVNIKSNQYKLVWNFIDKNTVPQIHIL